MAGREPAEILEGERRRAAASEPSVGPSARSCSRFIAPARPPGSRRPAPPTETLKTSVSRFSMKSRIGSPKRQSSAAIRKKRMPREITEATVKVSEVEVEGAARDGDQLVGDGRRPLDDDEPGAPAVVEVLQRLVLLGDAVEAQQRLADGVEGEVADGIAEEAAEHRGGGGDQRVEPGPPAVGDDHRDSSASGGIGKNELSTKLTTASAQTAWREAASDKVHS